MGTVELAIMYVQELEKFTQKQYEKAKAILLVMNYDDKDAYKFLKIVFKAVEKQKSKLLAVK